MRKFTAIFIVIILFFTAFVFQGCELIDYLNNNLDEEPEEKITYTVTFDTLGGTNVATQQVEIGNPAKQPVSPLKKDYFFEGWFIDAEYEMEFDFTTPIDESITLYAKWSPLSEKIWNVKFLLDEETVISELNVNHGTYIEKPSDPEKNGYQFLGWYTDPSFQIEFNFSSPIRNDTSIYAKFLKKLTISYYVDEKLYLQIDVIEGDNFLYPDTYPNKEGYVFEGWYLERELTTKMYTVIKLTENINVYAKFWAGSVINVTYCDESGKTWIVSQYPNGSYISNPLEYKKEGAIFLGWFPSQSSTIPFDFSKPITKPVTLYARFDKNYYTLTYMNNDGTVFTVNEIDDTEQIVQPAYPTRAGYIFMGWYADQGCQHSYEFNKYIYSDTTIYIKWLPATSGGGGGSSGGIPVVNTYTVTFVQNNGTQVFVQYIQDGSYIYTEPVPNITGKTFLGWYIDEAHTQPCVFPLQVRSSMTIYGDFKLNSFIYALLSDGTYEITSFIGEETEVVIPSEYNQIAVTSIGENAFMGSNITIVTIPDSITNIGEAAFSSCNSLTDISIGNNISNLDFCVFLNSNNINYNIIDNVKHLGNTINPYLVAIGMVDNTADSLVLQNTTKLIYDEAFFGCKNITSVIIPDSVISLGWRVFKGCSNLASVSIGSSLRSIGYHTFEDCNSLTNITVSESNLLYRSFDGDIYTKDSRYLVQYALGKEATSFIVPSTVITISQYAFCTCQNLTEVIIPDSVTEIQMGTFSKCTNLIQISIGTGLSTIGFSAFDNCDSLTSIIIPGNVTNIDMFAFNSCDLLESVTLNEGTTTIGEYAFGSCSHLLTVEIPNSVVNIGDYAFYNCTSLTNAVIGNGIENISDGLFNNCTNLASVTFGNSIVSIGDSAFYRSGLPTLSIPDTVTSIADNSFKECGNLIEITIGNGLNSIGNYAFNSCTGLTIVSFGSNVANIGEYAFAHCDSLLSITIPPSVTGMGEGVFYNCLNLTTATINGATGFGTFCDCPLLATVIIGDSVASIEEGCFADCVSLTDITIGNSVTTIGDNAFENCSNLASLALPAILTSIGDHAFVGCYALTVINIPNSVISLGSGAFKGCTRLTSIVLPDGITVLNNELFYNCVNLANVTLSNLLTEIGNSTFYGCTTLTSIALPNSLSSIGNNAFMRCSNINNIILPETLTFIGSGAFKNCTNLTDITIPDGVTILYEELFYECSNLANVTIGNLVTDIGNSLFYGCPKLKSIVLPDSLTNIGESAFSNCINLTEIALPNGITILNDGLFKECWSLRSVILGNSVSKICNAAFYRCQNLTVLILPESLTIIEDYAFTYSSSLTTITIPSNVTSIGKSSFEECSSLSSINLGMFLTKISDSAFRNCRNLRSITLPENLSYLGSYVFIGCCSLEEILVDENNAKFISIDGNLYNKACTTLIKYASGKTATSFVVPDGIIDIKNYAFCDAENLTYITISDSTKCIFDYAFRGCVNLTYIVIPVGVTYIGGLPFYGCENLTIYCEAESQPVGWLTTWCCYNFYYALCDVVWGYTEE